MPLSQRGRARDAPNSARDRPQLEPLKRDLPNLDLQVEIPAIASRRASFGNRRRILPTGLAGARLAPLHQGNDLHRVLAPLAPRSLGIPLVEQDGPIPSLRPTCPWDPSDGSRSNRHCHAEELLAPTVLHAAEESNGRRDSEDSACESNAWTEVEKAMHSAFLEDSCRGNSPTVAADEAILQCRSESQGVLSY